MSIDEVASSKTSTSGLKASARAKESSAAVGGAYKPVATSEEQDENATEMTEKLTAAAPINPTTLKNDLLFRTMPQLGGGTADAGGGDSLRSSFTGTDGSVSDLDARAKKAALPVEAKATSGSDISAILKPKKPKKVAAKPGAAASSSAMETEP